ncbi:MAG TPA: hypothetical protein VMB52_05755 [Verrucomicrobiae bacterium]|nr:hypothetical protein [Verrucomicrobiae bacterium]
MQPEEFDRRASATLRGGLYKPVRIGLGNVLIAQTRKRDPDGLRGLYQWQNQVVAANNNPTDDRWYEAGGKVDRCELWTLPAYHGVGDYKPGIMRIDIPQWMLRILANVATAELLETAIPGFSTSRSVESVQLSCPYPDTATESTVLIDGVPFEGSVTVDTI